jgi:hypothetical protein
MDFSLNFMRGYFAFIGLFIFSCCVTFCVRRLLWKRRKRQGRRNLGFCPTYTSAGNALQALQVMAQPRVVHVLAEKFDDEADDDAEGGPDSPEKHLHRQLRRIRRGEKVERLTILQR